MESLFLPLNYFSSLWRVKLRNETFILSARIRLQTQNNPPCVFSWWYFFFLSDEFFFLCCTRFVACYTNCAEYRTTRRRENCLFKISCFTLRRWLRMQRYKRTRENRSRLRRRCRRDTKCYCARHADDDTSNRESDERGLCHITETAGKSFSSLCFHFEFSSATDNHAVERHLSSEPHSTINKKKSETRMS